MFCDRLRARLATGGHEVAVYDGTRKVSGSELAELAVRAAKPVESVALHPDEAVAFVVRNRLMHLAALFGVLATGRPIRFVNAFQSDDKICRDLEAMAARIVLADAQDWESAPLGRWREIGTRVAISLGTATCTALPHDPGSIPTPGPLLPGVAVEISTSGTTGVPKAVRFSHDTLADAIADQALIAASMGEAPASSAPEASLIQYAPIIHIAGLWTALQMIIEGRRLVLFEKFNADAWIGAVRDLRPRMAGMSPPLLRMVLDREPPVADLASLRAIRCGSTALDEQTRALFEKRYKIPLLGVYGATEYAGVIASWSLDDWLRHGAGKRGSVGRLRDHVAQARTIGEDGGVLGAGEQGLLEVLVPRVSATWMRSTDIASLDADGFLTLHGRADNAITRGGFKILPDRLVSILRRHPAVSDAAVIGLPDDRLGQVPVAAVELREGASATPAELKRYMRAELPAYQVPTEIRVVARLPRTPSSKIIITEVASLFGG